MSSPSLSQPPLPALLGFGDLYRVTFGGAVLLCSAQTSVICIDVSFMPPVSRHKGTVAFNLPAFYTANHASEGAGGGCLTHLLKSPRGGGGLLVHTRETASTPRVYLGDGSCE